eukprot:3273552-Karenia_brevis.AAC.1
MDAKEDIHYNGNRSYINWQTANIVAYIDGGSQGEENILASAWLVKVFSSGQPKLRIIAAGARFHEKAVKHGLAVEMKAMQK